MPSYYVSYLIVDGSNNRQIGAGRCVMTRDRPPANFDEIEQLSRDVTDFNHQEGRMGGQYAIVDAWSEMSG